VVGADPYQVDSDALEQYAAFDMSRRNEDKMGEYSSMDAPPPRKDSARADSRTQMLLGCPMLPILDHKDRFQKSGKLEKRQVTHLDLGGVTHELTVRRR